MYAWICNGRWHGPSQHQHTHIQFYLSPKTIKAQMAPAILHARRPHPARPQRARTETKENKRNALKYQDHKKCFWTTARAAQCQNQIHQPRIEIFSPHSLVVQLPFVGVCGKKNYEFANGKRDISFDWAQAHPSLCPWFFQRLSAWWMSIWISASRQIPYSERVAMSISHSALRAADWANTPQPQSADSLSKGHGVLIKYSLTTHLSLHLSKMTSLAHIGLNLERVFPLMSFCFPNKKRGNCPE